MRSSAAGGAVVTLPPRCAACNVRDDALCATLEDAGLVALHGIGRRRTMPAGQVLVWSGDPNAICATVVSGVLKAMRAGPQGREHIVGLAFAGDFVGDLFADTANETIRVITDAELCVYPRAALQNMLDAHPAMERLLLHRALGALDDARMWMLMLGRKAAGARIATFLLEMARRMGQPGPARFDLPMSRSEVGALLGMTIETVSRQMTSLKRRGVVALPGGRGVIILDRAQLARAAAG